MGSVSLLPNLRSISLCLPVTCSSCKAVSDTYEPFLDIPLDIKVRCFAVVVQNVSGPGRAPGLPPVNSVDFKLWAATTQELGGGWEGN